jgi:hypothetical protein
VTNNSGGERNPSLTLKQIAERTRRMRHEFPETNFSTSASNTARERDRLKAEAAEQRERRA